MLKNNKITSCRWEFYVIIFIESQLLCYFGQGIPAVKVHMAVPVRNVENFLSVLAPHRGYILINIVSYPLRLSTLVVKNPDIIGHTSGVSLPCPELPEYIIISQLLAIRGERCKPPIFKRYGNRHPSL